MVRLLVFNALFSSERDSVTSSTRTHGLQTAQI